MLSLVTSAASLALFLASPPATAGAGVEPTSPSAATARDAAGKGNGARSTGDDATPHVAVGAQAAREAERQAPRIATERTLGGPWPLPPDGVRPMRAGGPSVQRRAETKRRSPAVGWAAALGQDDFADRRRRRPTAPLETTWVQTLRPGERFDFEVEFAGNPTGRARAWVAGVERDPNGQGELLRLEGTATTSGLISMLATLEDDMVALVDRETGLSVRNENVVRRGGLMPSYRNRETVTQYVGRGFVRVTDARDGKARSAVREIPEDTVDPLSALVWIRNLDLEKGQRAHIHTLDVTTVVRIAVVSRGRTAVPVFPSLAAGLGIRDDELELLEGTITEVDRWGDPIPERPEFRFRAWISDDAQRIPVYIESDLWAGVIRMQLSSYDPPRD